MQGTVDGRFHGLTASSRVSIPLKVVATAARTVAIVRSLFANLLSVFSEEAAGGSRESGVPVGHTGPGGTPVPSLPDGEARFGAYAVPAGLTTDEQPDEGLDALKLVHLYAEKESPEWSGRR